MAALLMAVSNGLAQDAGKPGPRTSRLEIIKKYDKNGDGKLDNTELKTAREDLQKSRGEGQGTRNGAPAQTQRVSREDIIKKYDKNGDGSLDETERNALREEIMKRRANTPKGRDPGQGGRAVDRAALFKEFDKDGDGKLSDTERQAAMTAVRERSQVHRVPGRAGGPGAGPVSHRYATMKKYDKNGDGKLDESERTAMREGVQKNIEKRRSRPLPKAAPEAKKD